MKVWIKVAVSVGLLALIFWILPWADVRAAVARVSGRLWIGILGGFVLGHLTGVLKWRLVVNAGRAHLKRLDAAMCYGAGLFANLCLPSIVGGDVLRAALASRLTGRPEAMVLGGVFDRLSDITALGVFIAAGALISRHALPGAWAGALTALLVVGVVAAAVFLPLALRRPLKNWGPKLRRPVGRTLVALRRFTRRPGIAFVVLGLSLLIQGWFVVLNAVIGRELGVIVPLGVWFLVWPLAKIVSLLPISLGGLAVREATLAALLVPFGVAPATGVVVSLVWQSVLIGGGLAGGIAWLLLRQRTSVAESGAQPTLTGHPHG